MKAIMKDGTEYEIDTTYLFEDQYNTVPDPGKKEGKRIYDGQIARIIDDVRFGLGKCKYCGKIVIKGEEEQHFIENEALTCDGCWWYQKQLVDETRAAPVVYKTTDDDGVENVEEIRHITQKWKYGCRYEKSKTDCIHNEHRAFGINWFTPENTFFLQNPNGFELMNADNLAMAGFEPVSFAVKNGDKVNGTWTWTYAKKLGSYTLTAYVVYDNGEKVGIEAFSVENARVWHRFRYEKGKWFTNDYRFGWKQRKSLEKVPDDVIEKVKRILKEVNGDDFVSTSIP